MTRRTVLAGVAGVVAVSGILALALRPGGSAASPNQPSAPVATAAVERRTLLEQEDLDGTLEYAGSGSVVGQRPGTVTAVPPVGAVVERGQTLYEVDGRAVPLLVGTRPMWRNLDETVADGSDVRQLEENLVALGYGGGFKVDDHYTSDTSAAVRRWQRARGVEQTGSVAVGDVAFMSGAVRVTAHRVEPGGRAEGELLTVTSTTRAVSIDLDASRQSLLAVGDAVEVELPDGSRVAGTVASVGAAATSSGSDDVPGGEEETTVEVTVSLAEAPTGLDQAPVTVWVTRHKADNVLTVPVNALLARPGGGYAVDVVEGTRRRRVPVETGLFADGRVEVQGRGLALREGQKVVVPA